ncbi:hypothetical protein [Pasteurella multocida]|uniref:hypothetical protein n=1 Tax=Pasteurella multocida TaxID=747 RepID=UPI0020202B3C|nr:hypothetical protein [Pasteurella multocida]MCL7799055.1 hypothetical protein [Pasteurella multocida]MCL7806601.1 hypothetical protein [Pasteurella multocida]MCL7806962.1 hypothetical protein [Pasteurella multocida]MCL7810395.1 hypothetical protein [Pasteurella multocida]MCL7813540.1 hypothetical protein [Pasteurella multocida]
MKYFDTKKSLPVLCSLLITACSGGGGGNNNVPHPPVEKRTVATTQQVAAKPTQPSESLVKRVPNNSENNPPSRESEKKASQTPPQTDSAKSTIQSTPAVIPDSTNSLTSKKEQIQMSPEWIGKEEKKYAQYSWEHTPESIPVFKLIENNQYKYVDDKYFTLEPINLNLTKENQVKERSYQFSLLDSGVYYGHYLSSNDGIHPEYNFVIAFDKNREYTLKDITAEYYNSEGFNYAISDRMKGDYIWQVGDVRLFYTNGSVHGEIVEVNDGSKTALFRFENTADRNPNQIVIVPERDNRHGLSPRGDRMIMDMHFINGSDGEKYKYVVGHGNSDRYYGTLFATKKDKK